MVLASSIKPDWSSRAFLPVTMGVCSFDDLITIALSDAWTRSSEIIVLIDVVEFPVPEVTIFIGAIVETEFAIEEDGSLLVKIPAIKMQIPEIIEANIVAFAISIFIRSCT